MKPISNQRALDTSIGKLAILEEEYRSVAETEPNPALRRAVRMTLVRLINQFKEEISRYRAGAAEHR